MSGLLIKGHNQTGVYLLVPLPSRDTQVYGDKKRFRFAGDVDSLRQESIPDLTGRSHRIDAEITVVNRSTLGVIVAEGGRYGGFTLYLKDGYLIYESNTFG